MLNLCLPTCDPLAQDCPNGLLCIHDIYDERWVCALDASGDEGQAFDPCPHGHACDPGLHCAEPELAGECDPMASGCCLPLCDLDLPNTCPGQGQACVAWYPPVMPRPASSRSACAPSRDLSPPTTRSTPPPGTPPLGSSLVRACATRRRRLDPRTADLDAFRTCFS
ncbi:hypothetical protein [Nannocystis pusilla]|uniref:hypothetical protein n=1 Tax=Nannocystis pusilla TaxID=889268 RepID=UPI003B7A985C